MADYGSSRTRTQVSWSAAWISFWNSEDYWSSVNCRTMNQMCPEYFWCFALFWELQQGEYIIGTYPGAHTYLKTSRLPTLCTVWTISFDWESWATSVWVALPFQVPGICFQSQEPTFILESSNINDTLTALPFFTPFSLTIQIWKHLPKISVK